MLKGISRLEYQKLEFSVGKTTRHRRPLSPVEVGELCERAVLVGNHPNEIAEALKMVDKGMVSKFRSLKRIVPNLRHLISWGLSDDVAIGFSVAAQLARLPHDQQPQLAEAILKYRLTRNEMVSIIQLRARSNEPLESCVQRVVRRRRVVRLQQIVLGAITAGNVVAKLQALTQVDRDDILRGIVQRLFPGAKDFSAKMGADRFAIIGGKSIAETVAADSQMEQHINNCLVEELA